MSPINLLAAASSVALDGIGTAMSSGSRTSARVAVLRRACGAMDPGENWTASGRRFTLGRDDKARRDCLPAHHIGGDTGNAPGRGVRNLGIDGLLRHP